MPTGGRSGTRSRNAPSYDDPKTRLVERAGSSLIAEGSGSSAGNQVVQDRVLTHGQRLTKYRTASTTTIKTMMPTIPSPPRAAIM
jgi:hypothetical protein